MSHAVCFPPVAGADATRLVLGSVPGQASLRAGQYYAHPRNLFWLLMEDLLGIDRALPYSERCEALKGHRIALWDVLDTCFRPGSLDTSIDDSTAVPNDLAGFLTRHPGVDAIYFNGGKAEQVFNHRVLPTLPAPLAAIRRVRLPSTSPANASVSLEAKRTAWAVLR